MKKIYVIRFDNNAVSVDYEEKSFKYCYKTKQEAQQAIEELLQDKDFLIENSVALNPLDRENFWIEELELV